MNLPSKELLSKALSFDCSMIINGSADNEILYRNSKEAFSINIYELAHKCKEWAYKNGYSVTTMNDYGFKNSDTDNFESYWTTCYINLQPTNGTHLHSEVGTTEQKSIFKACQWILDNKETK